MIIVLGTSCKKIVQVDAPYTSISDENVFKEDNNAIAVLTGIFTQMSQAGTMTGNSSINLYAGLSADELVLYNSNPLPNYVSYYTNSLLALSPAQNYGSELWSPLYSYIYQCNAAIEGLNGSTSLTASVKKQLLGEAKFLRAFFYFYLVNLYGDVPLALSADYKVNGSLARSSTPAVYQQIIIDLNDAKELLSSDYLNGNLKNYPSSLLAERVRPNKWAAIALLARVQLYAGNWSDAESSASDLIENNTMYDTVALNDVFLKNSREAIWQLQPVRGGSNTEEAKTFILSPDLPNGYDRPVYLSSQLLNSFELNDQRKVAGNWIDSCTLLGTTYFFPFKYKNIEATVTEYFMVLRLGEQYLIRSEARANLGNINGGASDLNVIRARAGLSPTTANDQNSLMSAILHENQVELFTEWANRWFDLKRTGKVDAVMNIVTPMKSNGAVHWQSYQQIYPILFSDLKKNQSLKQNLGY
ncbi:hypothetical protein A4H97_29890 [Niastella yeongjuensis]|uniref:Carbohydrate-binding protein SusD n=2 Tax=Niastella yeongjuensis TaxID=354355 RepID=A0A1V9EPQ5_9BACT|nr:hypothetical protein A4H97_29890 [Niastella yeongjuensis]